MQRGVPTITCRPGLGWALGLALGLGGLGPFGCGGEPEVGRSEVQALLQRLDAMERRLDALEQPPPAASPTSAVPMTAPLADPFARPSVGPAAAKSLHVTVTPTGLSIDGRDLTRDQARRRFESAAAEIPPPRLVVVAESSVSHAAMVDVLDLAHEAGLEDVAMSARIHGPADPIPE
ncbi:ExbD/TolR family protein [Paraliomyxa miuraensis]|uniref:ExbD/TolR family protein n=1 Tax=Paraliomyxa miuraensis TaxID=376150 RepID=UPI0022563DB9|nr:biopolymer transporter ExbD [Paraliomyxa miuraensis]MCX4242226.1 biopolymer transporter ExbD [Paraliomyxa miuraensis]